MSNNLNCSIIPLNNNNIYNSKNYIFHLSYNNSNLNNIILKICDDNIYIEYNYKELPNKKTINIELNSD